jgi:multiple sugar transport system permease protein
VSASVETEVNVFAAPRARRLARLRHLDLVGLVITAATLVAALWAFPLYWGLVTTFKPENEVVRPAVQVWSEHFTFQNYVHVLLETKIGIWYVNSLITSAAVTVLLIVTAAGAGYAISQLSFPGRRLFWWMILASFMVPIPALTVNHFILINQFGLNNTLPGAAAAHRASHRHYLQAIFRFRAEGFSRGRNDRWRE